MRKTTANHENIFCFNQNFVLFPWVGHLPFSRGPTMGGLQNVLEKKTNARGGGGGAGMRAVGID